MTGYTTYFLVDNGAEPGSSVQMTPKGFMTNKAWHTMTPQLMEGICSMLFIRDNPDWYVLEIADGFGAHLNNYDALKMRLDANIICAKEEGDSSSVNQAYDNFVAKSDKHEHRLTLGMPCKRQGANNIFNQWQMVHCGLSASRAMAANPDMWVGFFKAVNLHPKFQMSFNDWCKKMAPFMQAADSFDLVMQDNVDKYKVLPAL